MTALTEWNVHGEVHGHPHRIRRVGSYPGTVADGAIFHDRPLPSRRGESGGVVPPGDKPELRTFERHSPPNTYYAG